MIDLSERPPRIGRHIVHEMVDGLYLRKEIPIVEVGEFRQWLGHFLADPCQPEHLTDHVRRRTSQNSVERREQVAARNVHQWPERRDEWNLGEIEGRSDRD